MPKRHFLHHLGPQILRDGMVLDCFPVERKRRLLKAYTSHLRAGPGFERGIFARSILASAHIAVAAREEALLRGEVLCEDNANMLVSHQFYFGNKTPTRRTTLSWRRASPCPWCAGYDALTTAWQLWWCRWSSCPSPRLSQRGVSGETAPRSWVAAARRHRRDHRLVTLAKTQCSKARLCGKGPARFFSACLNFSKSCKKAKFT